MAPVLTAQTTRRAGPAARRPIAGRMLPAALAAALAGPAAAGAAEPPSASRVVGGQPAGPASWPSIAHIEATSTGGALRCAGTVVAPHWVLTAAHCTVDRGAAIGPGRYRVTTGRSRLSDTASGQALGVNDVARHPTADLALLHLGAPTSAPPMRIGLGGGAPAPDPGVPNVAGWGSRATGQGASDTLIEAHLPVRDDATCAAYAGGAYTPDAQFCAGGSGAGTCQGDSGGPLVVFDRSGSVPEPVLWGVTSFGPVPCGAGPSFFVRVGAHADFLARTVAERSAPLPVAGPRAPTGAARAPATTPAVPRDRFAPRLTRLRVSGKPLVLRVRSSEPARLRIDLLRRDQPAGATRRVSLRAGPNRVTLIGTRWTRRHGTYRLRLRATDAAGNTRTATVTVRLRAAARGRAG